MNSKRELSLLGIGPVLALVGGVALVSVCLLKRAAGVAVEVGPPLLVVLRVAGIGWGLIGLWFWIASAILITRGYQSHRLVTTGVYHYSRNPMYSSLIVFLIPAASFLTGNLLILLVSGFMFAAFKVLIRKEEADLSREFGEQYQCYASQVPQLVPFMKVRRTHSGG